MDDRNSQTIYESAGGKEKCYNATAKLYLNQNIEPIDLTMKYKVVDECPGSDGKIKLFLFHLSISQLILIFKYPEFCKEHVVIDHDDFKEITNKTLVNKGCASLICQVNLNLTGAILEP